MTIRTRALVSALLAASALSVAAVPAAHAATSLASQPATSSACHYTGGRLSSITAAGPRVREQAWFRSHHVRQHSHYQASVQRLVGTKWTTISATSKKRTLRLRATTTTMPKFTLRVPSSSTAKKYRVATVIGWAGRGGRVVHKQRMVLAHYTGGSACAAKKSGTYPPLANQTITVTANPGGAVPTGTTLGGTFTVSGLVGSETVNVGWYSASGDCSDYGPYVTQVAVPGNGTYALPSYGAGFSGPFSVGVMAPGNEKTNTAKGCSAQVSVYHPVSVQAISPTEDSSLNRTLSGPIQQRLQYGGFDRDTYVTWTATLWGPYSTLAAANAANCDGAAHRTIDSQSPVIGIGGASYNLSEPASSMNGGSPAFWRFSVATTVNSNQQWESVPAKVCSAVFHTQN